MLTKSHDYYSTVSDQTSKMGCPIWGTSCSRYYMVISIWGIVMLALLGIFFWVRSPALFEDVPLGDWEANHFSKDYAKTKYEQNAINCWIAAAIYVVLFIFSFVQYKMNNRSNYEMS
ncbi:ribonuclease kappa-like [Babylonia areolata]|uniref:ribonuclease kappa-like n=1 Tax=Babylonia areolata TaxID=304850 RepID=UPI003FD51733